MPCLPGFGNNRQKREIQMATRKKFAAAGSDIQLSTKTKKISLALQGGGSHGAFAWGVLDKLLEDGRLEIEAVSGTSAGSMNAVALASGAIEGPDAARQKLCQLCGHRHAVLLVTGCAVRAFHGRAGRSLSAP